jgi:hypothetical protein
VICAERTSACAISSSEVASRPGTGGKIRGGLVLRGASELDWESCDRASGVTLPLEVGDNLECRTLGTTSHIAGVETARRRPWYVHGTVVVFPCTVRCLWMFVALASCTCFGPVSDSRGLVQTTLSPTSPSHGSEVRTALPF